MRKFEYEYFTHEDKITYLEAELKRLEGQHFALSLSEPPRLQTASNNGDDYINWQRQIEGAENFIHKIKKQLAQVKDNG